MNPYIASRTLFCPQCKTAHTTSAKTVMQVCKQCNTVFDTKQTVVPFTQNSRAEGYCKSIAIGTEFIAGDIIYTVTGKMVKYEKDKVADIWTEYFLTHPTEPTIYLYEYGGHWNIVRQIAENEPNMVSSNTNTASKKPNGLAGKWNIGNPNKQIYYNGEIYTLAHHYRPAIAYAVGAFEEDIIAENNINSYEYITAEGDLLIIDNDLLIIDNDKVTKKANFYAATYIFETQLKKQLQGEFKPANKTVEYGINQPFYIDFSIKFSLIFCVCLFIGITIFHVANRVIYSSVTVFNASNIETNDSSRTLTAFPTIKIPYDNSIINVELRVNDLSNDWAGAEVSLINDKTDEERFFSIETEYYSGIDGGESCREGSLTNDGNLNDVAAGTYHIEITPFQQVGTSPKNLTLTITNFKSSHTVWGVFCAALLVLIGLLVWVQSAFHDARKAFYDLE
jgi:hypothetical protein